MEIILTEPRKPRKTQRKWYHSLVPSYRSIATEIEYLEAQGFTIGHIVERSSRSSYHDPETSIYYYTEVNRPKAVYYPYGGGAYGTIKKPDEFIVTT